MVSTAIVISVPPLDKMSPLAQQTNLGRINQPMGVVGHEAVVIDMGSQGLGVFVRQRKIAPAVLVLVKDRFSSDSTVYEVVATSGAFLS